MSWQGAGSNPAKSRGAEAARGRPLALLPAEGGGPLKVPDISRVLFLHLGVTPKAFVVLQQSLGGGRALVAASPGGQVEGRFPLRAGSRPGRQPRDVLPQGFAQRWGVARPHNGSAVAVGLKDLDVVPAMAAAGTQPGVPVVPTVPASSCSPPHRGISRDHCPCVGEGTGLCQWLWGRCTHFPHTGKGLLSVLAGRNVLSVAAKRRQKRLSSCGMVGSPGTAESRLRWSPAAAVTPVPLCRGRDTREKRSGTVPQVPAAAPAAMRQPTNTTGKWGRVSHKFGAVRAAWDAVARLTTGGISLRVLRRIHLCWSDQECESPLSGSQGQGGCAAALSSRRKAAFVVLIRSLQQLVPCF